MAAYVRTLKDGNDIIYPQTKVSGVYDANNVSLDTLLNNLDNKIIASTTDLTAGSSALATGKVYLVYE